MPRAETDRLADIEHSCARKKRYRTEDFAQRVARDCLRQRGARLHVYACQFCGGFHLGKDRRQAPAAGAGEG